MGGTASRARTAGQKPTLSPAVLQRGLGLKGSDPGRGQERLLCGMVHDIGLSEVETLFSLPSEGELPHIPERDQNASAEDSVPRHWQELQAAVYVSKGPIPPALVLWFPFVQAG